MNIKKASLLLISFISFNALASVAVIINPANTSEISQIDIQKIYMGKSKTFANGERAHMISLDPGNPLTTQFRAKVLNKTNSQYKSHWSKLVFTGKSKPAKEVATEAEIVNFVKSNISAIGFVNQANVPSDVKIIAVF